MISQISEVEERQVVASGLELILRELSDNQRLRSRVDELSKQLEEMVDCVTFLRQRTPDVELEHTIREQKNKTIEALTAQRASASRCLEEIAKMIAPGRHLDWAATVDETRKYIEYAERIRGAVSLEKDAYAKQAEKIWDENQTLKLEIERLKEGDAFFANNPVVLRQILSCALEGMQTVGFTIPERHIQRAAKMMIKTTPTGQLVVSFYD